MKHKLFLLLSLPAVLMITACGKNNDQPAVVDNGAVTATSAANSCQSGYVYNPTYGCLPAQYGQPPGYNGGGTGMQVTIPTQHYCNGTNAGFGYSGNGSNGCWNNGYSYHWQYYGGFYYYW